MTRKVVVNDRMQTGYIHYRHGTRARDGRGLFATALMDAFPRLPVDSKRELADTTADYRRGLVPVVVPLTLLRHYVRMFDVAYLAGQTHLQPHPKELMLRNHV
jgi:hypothetical protein